MSILKHFLFCTAALLGMVLHCSAEDFPVTFKKIEPKDFKSFPGGIGKHSQHLFSKPSAVTKENAAVSKRPIYGEFRLGAGSSNRLVYRIDESKGDKKGYDQLILDLNQNGDLTDDTACSRITLPGEPKPSTSFESGLFGPFSMKGMVSGEHPVCYVQCTIYTSAVRQGQGFSYLGYARLKAGWYLQSMVTLDGVQRLIGIYDADTSLTIGEVARANTSRNLTLEEQWSIRGGDLFLIDANSSGKFENDTLSSESEPFGSILYLGNKPYNVELSADRKSLAFSAWSEPLAKVSLKPAGEQVYSVEIARKLEKDQWQLLKIPVTNGLIYVPPGAFRLYSCKLLGRTATGEPIFAEGILSTPKKPFEYQADSTNTLRCGAPLKIKVGANKHAQSPASNNSFEYNLVIGMTVTGQGGEVYRTYGKGNGLAGEPANPKFSLLDSKGVQIASGNMEYG